MIVKRIWIKVLIFAAKGCIIIIDKKTAALNAWFTEEDLDMGNGSNAVKPGVYRHFKGGIYRVLYTAKHSETLEEMVVYQSCKDGSYWVRPASMWNETVDRDGEVKPRFTFIGDEE